MRTTEDPRPGGKRLLLFAAGWTQVDQTVAVMKTMGYSIHDPIQPLIRNLIGCKTVRAPNRLMPEPGHQPCRLGNWLQGQRCQLFDAVQSAQNPSHPSTKSRATGRAHDMLPFPYLEREEDCLAVRGSILLNRQLTSLANRTDLIACRYDELTADNHWNRLIKAGLRAVRPWMHGVALQRSWIELMAGFDEVTDIAEARSLLTGLRYDRQGSRYRPAIEWVERILSLLSPDLRAGTKPAPGLLFDMNRLFEAVVEQRMQSWAWNRGWSVEAQNFTHYLADIVDAPKRKAFKVRPDLLFTQRGQTVAIADAKWKHPSLSPRRFVMPDQADLYQLHGYASVFRGERLALIYPWDESMAGARETTLELPGSEKFNPCVTVLCLDVADDNLTLRLQTDAWAEYHVATAHR